MIERNEPFETANDEEFSILSWNILAPHLDRNGAMDWSQERLPLILQELQSCNADILCLQEMQQNCMEDDFVPTLKNYNGIRADGGDNASVATFWKMEKYVLQHVWGRNRSLICILKEKTGAKRNLAVVNVHLDEHPERVFTRIQQLQLLMKQLRLHRNEITGIVFCGDFGCPQKQSACTSYLQEGGNKPLESVVENNSFFDVYLHPHSFRFAPSYSLSELPVSVYFTYGAGKETLSGCYAAGIDQLWHSETILKPKHLRRTFTSEEQREAILKEGMPSRWNPSDHMPIGAIMEWQNSIVALISDDDDVSSICSCTLATLSEVSDDSSVSDDPNPDDSTMALKTRTCAIFGRIESEQELNKLFQESSEGEKFFIESCVQVLFRIGTTIPKKETKDGPITRWFRMFYDGLLSF
mmetsp:Transcript_6760/g.9867  ORF Transcript_6760/g.9867 Transcript_6760/m.9867 type:complete len:412 (-) Transcript_6760:79-1314(-)